MSIIALKIVTTALQISLQRGLVDLRHAQLTLFSAIHKCFGRHYPYRTLDELAMGVYNHTHYPNNCHYQQSSMAGISRSRFTLSPVKLVLLQGGKLMDNYMQP